MIVGFSGFGFPKAHGAAFGLLAYQSTWLRVHYGPEFLCSLLDEQPMGFYPPDALVHEAQRRGIEVLAPDVNASAVGCTVVTSRRGPALPPAPGARAVATRAHPRRPRRCPCAGAPRPLAPPSASASATCSACAATRSRRSSPRARPAGRSGRSTTWPRARARAARRSSSWPGRAPATRWRGGAGAALWHLGAAAPGDAAGAGGTQLALPLELPAAPALRGARRLGRDDRRLRDHRPDRRPPSRCACCARACRERGIATSADLADLPHGAQVRVGGLVVARQRPGTAKGVVFLLLEDETGTINLIVPPPVYERHRLTVRTEPLVVVEGVLERLASARGRDQRARRPPRAARRARPALPPSAPRGQGLLDARRARARPDRTRAAARGRGGGRRRDGRPRAPGSRVRRDAAARRRMPRAAAASAGSGGPARCAGPRRRSGRAGSDGPTRDRRRAARQAPTAPGETGASPAEPVEPLPAGGTGRRGLPRRGPADHELRPGSAAMMGGGACMFPPDGRRGDLRPAVPGPRAGRARPSPSAARSGARSPPGASRAHAAGAGSSRWRSRS